MPYSVLERQRAQRFAPLADLDAARCTAEEREEYEPLPITLDASAVRGRRVVIVEDGPTIAHGSMPFGAGFVAASAAGGELGEVFQRYPHIGPVLPAIGYTAAQLEALAETIRRVDVEVVVGATPVDLARLIAVDKPIVRARYRRPS